MTDSTLRDDPLDQLSLETQATILSYLDRPDLLECTRVSRSWQKRVVDLGQIRWRCRIQPYQGVRRFIHGTVTDETFLLIPYYASHIESLHFRHYNDIEKICVYLRAMRDKGCTKIRQLTFSDCHIGNPEMFIDSLRGCVADNLHSFAITSTKTTLTPLSILTVCPQLRVLFYQVGPFGATEMNNEESSVLPNDVQFKQLVCLSIHGAIHESRLREILKRSPNLRFVRLCAATLKKNYRDYDYDDHTYSSATWPGVPELHAIRDHCQKIEHIELNRTQYFGKINMDSSREYDEMPWWKKYTEMDQAESPFSGLRLFKFIESENTDGDLYKTDIMTSEIFKVLQNNQQSLEALHLGNMSLRVGRGATYQGYDSIELEGCDIQDLSFPNLRELAFVGDIYLIEGELCQLLPKFPGLESLEISIAVEGILDRNLPNAIASLKALKSLSFKMPKWYDMESDGGYMPNEFGNESVNISRVLLALSASNDCRLEDLCLGGQVCGDLASVNGLVLTDEILDAVAKIPSLRKVQLHHDCLFQPDLPLTEQEERADLSSMEITVYGLKNFAKAIKKRQIEELWLGGIEDIPRLIFGSFGSVPSLRELHVTSHLQIDGLKLASLFGQRTRPKYKGKLIIHDHFYGVRFTKTVQKYTGKLKFCDDECSYVRHGQIW
ncbi:hypothetical protein BJV82DRAFT_673216 [Fennellomyces sp. T-0311]|nr:hypothetical protein BJV82DRAFT_673216 [Fennellomyces sp. T-0311]